MAPLAYIQLLSVLSPPPRSFPSTPSTPASPRTPTPLNFFSFPPFFSFLSFLVPVHVVGPGRARGPKEHPCSEGEEGQAREVHRIRLFFMGG